MAVTFESADYNDFDPDTLLPGQAAVFSANDPTSPDGKGLNVAFDKGNVKRLLTYDDLASLGVWAQHFCASGEYDASTGKPTIANPSTSCIYFVPVGDGVWTKWIYQGGSWVKIGSTDDITLVTTGMIEDGAVTDAKLSQPLRDSLSQGLVSSPHGEKINIWSDGSGYITIMLTAPGGVWRRVNIMKDGRLLWTDSTS